MDQNMINSFFLQFLISQNIPNFDFVVDSVDIIELEEPILLSYKIKDKYVYFKTKYILNYGIPKDYKFVDQGVLIESKGYVDKLTSFLSNFSVLSNKLESREYVDSFEYMLKIIFYNYDKTFKIDRLFYELILGDFDNLKSLILETYSDKTHDQIIYYILSRFVNNYPSKEYNKNDVINSKRFKPTEFRMSID